MKCYKYYFDFTGPYRSLKPSDFLQKMCNNKNPLKNFIDKCYNVLNFDKFWSKLFKR